jgi:hypothetical protein
MNNDYYEQWCRSYFARKYWKLSDKKMLRRNTRNLKRKGLAQGDLFN